MHPGPKKRLMGLLLAAILAAGLAGCGASLQQRPEAQQLSGPLTIAASHTALPLLEAARREFLQKHPDVTIQITAEGSLGGLEKAIQGTVDMAVSQVPATPGQEQELKEHRIAITPYVVIVHRDLALSNLALDKFAAILRGEITNWEEVGAPAGKITVVATPRGTGSRSTLVARVLEGEGKITPEAVTLASTREVQNRVAATVGGIGYVEAPAFNPALGKAIQIDQVPYTAQAFSGGSWPIFAYEHLYTRGEPQGLTRAFLQFLLSPDFQLKSVIDLKYVPIKGIDPK